MEGIKEGHGDANEVFVEVVEYADGVTICAVYEKDAQPGRCHRGGADSDHHGWSWHNNNRTKLNFNVKVPRGVVLKAMTTNGGIRGRDLNSVVDAATTNGNVDVATSEWASARTTNGGVTVAMGSAKWSGEIELMTTNGSVHASLPAASEFKVRAATTNGGIHTDFPVTVMGSFGSKDLSGTVGAGGRGPITEKIQKAFFEITKGERKAPGDWLTYVNTEKSAQPGSNGSQPATNVSVGNQTAEPVMKFHTAASVTD